MGSGEPAKLFPFRTIVGDKSPNPTPEANLVRSKMMMLMGVSHEKLAVVILTVAKISQLAISSDLVVLDAVSALVILTVMWGHHDITKALAAVVALLLSLHLRHNLESNYFQPLGLCELAAYILVVTLLTSLRSMLYLVEQTE